MCNLNPALAHIFNLGTTFRIDGSRQGVGDIFTTPDPAKKNALAVKEWSECVAGSQGSELADVQVHSARDSAWYSACAGKGRAVGNYRCGAEKSPAARVPDCIVNGVAISEIIRIHNKIDHFLSALSSDNDPAPRTTIGLCNIGQRASFAAFQHLQSPFRPQFVLQDRIDSMKNVTPFSTISDVSKNDTIFGIDLIIYRLVSSSPGPNPTQTTIYTED